PGADYKGRVIFDPVANDFRFWISAISTAAARMILNSTGLNVAGTVTSSSDNIFKINENH
ncbi:MAG: hypothetical protein ACKPKO_21720, partial [Candidatus Fonsibacter sp.]